MKKLHLIGSLALLLPCSAVASGPGSTSGELLKIPVSARAIGMGEAFTAAADDSSSLAWNPAGLSFMKQKEAAFMHSSLIEGVHYEHLAYAAPGESYSAGASMSYLGYGSISGYDNFGTPTGDQSAYSYILSGGISTFLRDRLSLGVTASLLRESLAGQSAGTFAANAGALYTLASHPLQSDVRLGASVLNIGPGLKFDSDRSPLPRKIKLGAAVMHLKHQPLNLTADLTLPNDNSTYLSVGSEYWFKDLIALRLGYTGSNDLGKGLRLGLGLKLREFLFDYAYGGFGDFGATHRIELTLRWGQPMRQLNSDQRAILKEAKRSGEKGDYIQQILAMNELLEKDPANDRLLKQMIIAHQQMLKKELKEAVAKNDEPKNVPSPEEFALQELIPGQAAIAQMHGPFNPSDPMGLNKLPDASRPEDLLENIQVPEHARARSAETLDAVPVQVPAADPVPRNSGMGNRNGDGDSQASPNTDSRSRSPIAPAQDGVLLNPADIFSN